METLREAFVHNDWATRRLFDEAGSFSDAELDRPFELFRTGFPTLRATLAHVADIERRWLDRWHGRPETAARALPRAPVAAIRENWEATAAARTAFLDGLPPGAGASRVSGVTSTGAPFALPLGDTLLHAADHGIHHRSQAMAILRSLGRKTPIGIDYLFFRGARPTLPWPDAMKKQWRDFGFPVPDTVDTPARFDRDTLAEYLRYSDRATRELIDAAEGLDDARLDESFPIGLRTLRRTLLHLFDAEEWWVRNWTGKGDGAFGKLPETTGLAELRGLLDGTIAERDAYLEGCDEETLQSPVTIEPMPGAPLTFRIAETVMQLPTHGTHHRAQALAMLKALGVPAPNISYGAYAERQYGG
jgi:uncharacterized damage-inducible protein DinB